MQSEILYVSNIVFYVLLYLFYSREYIRAEAVV